MIATELSHIDDADDLQSPVTLYERAVDRMWIDSKLLIPSWIRIREETFSIQALIT